MYAVWQTCRHFVEPGLQPWAISNSRENLEKWAKANIPALGQKRLFFAQKIEPTHDLTDARWSVAGFLYKDGIEAKRLDPERYVAGREGRRVWAVTDTYPAPTDDDWQRPTVNIDNKE
jgi:hypothetical protein